MDRLGALEVPGVNAADGQGSPAVVRQDIGTEQIERSGRVVRLLQELDPVARTARVLVEIENPITPSVRNNGETPNRSGLPILLGAYVQVEIESQRVVSAIEIPRSALRGGDRVYVYGPKDQLEIRAVQIVWRRSETVLVGSGLSEGESVIVSRLPGAVPGMRLRKASAPTL
jgi:hypothetical protein